MFARCLLGSQSIKKVLMFSRVWYFPAVADDNDEVANCFSRGNNYNPQILLRPAGWLERKPWKFGTGYGLKVPQTSHEIFVHGSGHRV